MDFDKIKEKAEEVFDIAAGPTTDIVSSMVLDGVIGSVAPGVVSAVLAYKQKRQERNYEQFMLLIKERCNELELKLQNLEEKSRKKFTSDYFGMISDYVLDEVQEEKIKYIVNGFINLASIENAKEDFVLHYYDILNELRVVDIAILKAYYDPDGSILKVMEQFDFDSDQVDQVRNKLVRLDLFYFISGSPIYDDFQLIKRGTMHQYGVNKLGAKFLEFFTQKYI